jgi:hypothetical protein
LRLLQEIDDQRDLATSIARKRVKRFLRQNWPSRRHSPRGE